MSNGATLRCADAEPYLSALADGEVAEPMRSIVAAHAATCEHCGEILAHHQAVNSVFATLPPSAPSPAVLDRVLAVRAASEPAQRESLRRRKGTLGVRRLATLLTIPRVEPRPALALPRPRSFWQSTALPTLVAVLLISFAFGAFSRVSPNLLGGQTAHTATPTPQGDAYQQAQAAVVSAVAAHPISYTPDVPWSLPPGATFQRAIVDPASGTLDIVWTLTDGLAQLHVREAPVALALWSDYVPSTSSLALAWQLPGKAGWRTERSASDTSRLAMVQDHGAYSVAVDVSFRGGVSVSDVNANTQSQATNILRLASLSMDSTRFTTSTILAPDTLHAVVHYVAQSGSGANRVQSDVYVDPDGNRARVTVSDSQGVLYEDFISGTNDTRYDPRHSVYQRLPQLSSPLGDALLDGRTATFFSYIDNYLADGELWYVGTLNANTDEFALTTAPYRTIIYVNVSSLIVLGAVVDYSTTQNVGAEGLVNYFTHNTCLSYTSVDYLSSAPATTFTPPKSYRAGTPPASVACPA